MRFATLTSTAGLSLWPHLKAGNRYLFDELNFHQLGIHGVLEDDAEFSPKHPARWKDWSRFLAGTRVLIIRQGGIGDIIFCLPGLVHLLATHPQVEFTFACHEEYFPVLSAPGLERLKLVAAPVLAEVAEEFEVIVPLEDVIERNDKQDAVTIFTEALGLKADIYHNGPALPSSDLLGKFVTAELKNGRCGEARQGWVETVEPLTIRGSMGDLYECVGDPHVLSIQPYRKVPSPHPCLVIPPLEVDAAWARWPKVVQGEVRVGVQLQSSAKCRDYPVELLNQAMDLIMQKIPTARIYIFAWGGRIGADHPRVVITGNEESPPPLAETLALLATMDIVLGPDSGLMHAAAALGLPTLGLFAAYSGKARLHHGGVQPKNVRFLTGHAPCAPCHYKGRAGPWPRFYPGSETPAPCNAAGHCVAMAKISPDRIAREVLAMLRGKVEKTAEIPAYEFGMQSFFGGINLGDVHPELPRAGEFHQGDWGKGAATVEEAICLYGLVLALKPTFCLETGTETGWTAAHIALGLEQNKHGHVITLETDPASAAEARANLQKYGLEKRVDVLEMSSFDYLRGYDTTPQPPDVCNPKIDFALLDTHIEMRAEELRLLTPHLSENAVVVVHDTSPLHPCRGDTELLAELRASGFQVIHLPTPRGLTVMQRGNEKLTA